MIDTTFVIGAFLVFCRIAACMAMMPGLGAQRIPMQARLFTVIGLTMALAPALYEPAKKILSDISQLQLAQLIGAEFFIGATFGLLARAMMAAIETLGSAASMAIGLSSMFSPRPDDGDSMPELASFVSFGLVALFFIMNLHFEVLRALADSYVQYPIGAVLDFSNALMRFTHTLGDGFLLALRLMSPFLVFSLLGNLAFALLNKLTPQIAVFFVSAPFVLMGGLLILYFSIDRILLLFSQALAGLIERG